MIKLLNANFVRIKKSKLFWVLSLAILLVTLIMIFNQYQDFQHSKIIVQYDNLYNFFLVFIGIVISIFTCMFLSIEYFDNTIRNKIIIGHKRIQIYFANLITIIIVSLVFELLFTLLISGIGIPLFGLNIESLTNFLYTIMMMQFIIIANASIYTFISMVCTNGMLINVICILLSFGSYFAVLILMNILEAPEYIQSATMTNVETGQIEYIKEKNPNYPSKIKRDICRTLIDIIPQGQSIIIASNKVTNKNLIVVYSLGTTAIFTSVGLVLFKKKELK